MHTSEKNTYIYKYPKKPQTTLARERQKCPFLSLCLEGGLTELVLLKHLPHNAQIVFFLMQRLPDSSSCKSKLSHSRV